MSSQFDSFSHKNYKRYNNDWRENPIQINKPYSFRIPDEYYSDKYVLFDIQKCILNREIIYIFLDNTGKKYYHRESMNKYYCYLYDEIMDNSPFTLPIEEVFLEMRRFDIDKYDKTASVYEGDIRTELKHSIDYRYNRPEEAFNQPLKIMYSDIEVYTGDSKAFPQPYKAEHPINSISFKISNEDVNLFLLRLDAIDSQHEIKAPENVNLTIFDDERTLLTEFAKFIRDKDPHILTGWNFLGFDIPYIVNRMENLGLDINLLSPLGIVSHDKERYGETYIFGTHIICMLDLFKRLMQSVESSYKLDTIANKYLNKGKVDIDGSMVSQAYQTDINTFIKYSATDSELLWELNKRFNHIHVQYELIKICASTWKASETSMGLLDPLIVLYAKNHNLVCKNRIKQETDKGLAGAYVHKPKSGLYSWVVDFDFSSMYPSIIRSMNIGPTTYIAKIDEKIAHDYIYDRSQVPDSFNICLYPTKRDFLSRVITKKQFEEFLDKIDGIITSLGTIFKGPKIEISFFTMILEYLMNSRSEYKSSRDKLKRENANQDDIDRYDNVQLAYKILANALYGVMGNPHFRFFNLDLAESVTRTGQELIKFTGYHLNKYMKTKQISIDKSFEAEYESSDLEYIIYQDTDSIFVPCGDYLIDEGKLSIY